MNEELDATAAMFGEAIDTHNAEEVLLDWPPDLFAFTAHVLKRTGAYRYIVNPRGEYLPNASTDNDGICFPPAAWKRDVDEDAERWLEWLCDSKQPKPHLFEQWHHFRTLAQRIKTADLQHCELWKEPEREICTLLLRFHALADH